MKKTLAIGVGAILAASTLLAVPASAAPSRNQSFVDVNDDGKYTRGVDEVFKPTRRHQSNVQFTGEYMGQTFGFVRGGHDLYINSDISAPNLVLVNRGGDMHIGEGVSLNLTGQYFAVATTSADGNSDDGALVFHEGSSLSHTFSLRGNSQAQIQAGDLWIGDDVNIVSEANSSRRTRSAASTTVRARFLVRGADSLEIAESATISAPDSELEIVGP